jgi:GT2 family glycosyltransferase
MTAPSPLLSIVIPSHHRADLLQDCLESVTLHAPAQTEIIVVDDGSPGAVISQAAQSVRGVQVIQLTRRSGFCIAANEGIRAARGQIIELLNDDTIVTPGWAEAALRQFSTTNIGAVAPLVFQGTPNQSGPVRIDSAGDEYDLGGFARKRGHQATLTDKWLQTCEVFGASASSAFYRRAALEQVGLFPEEFGAYFEDVDLSWRLNQAGYRTLFEPTSRVWHRCGSSYRRRSRKVIEQQSLNEERVFWRNVPSAKMKTALPRHVAVLIGKAVRRLREGNLVPFFMGRLRALMEFRKLLRHRGCIQRNHF